MTLTPDQRAHLDVAHALDPDNNPRPDEQPHQQTIDEALTPKEKRS